MNDIKKPDYDPADRLTLTRATASWFVRRDGKYYDVSNLGVSLCRADVHQICIQRYREEYPDISLTSDLIKAVFKAALSQIGSAPDVTIGVWNGQVVCVPGTAARLIRQRGLVSVNSWVEPDYRSLRTNAADYGAAGDLFAWMFPRIDEQRMVLDWLAWSLRHEDEKPTWAPFLYSRTKGSGKSTFCAVASALFGQENTVTQNNVEKLTGRFNMPVLQSKLVISEELKLKAGTPASNALKTFITETSALAEMKGQEAIQIEQRCCFLFTTNHMPLWIEPDDRRYYIVEIDHDGHASGPRAAEFAALVARVHEQLADPASLSRLYNALMERKLADDFSAKTLNIATVSTDVMKLIQNASKQVSTEQLREHLDEEGLNAVAESELVQYVQQHLRGNIETIRHKMIEIGWNRVSVKWGGKDYARALWVRGGCSVYRGQLIAPDGSKSDIPSTDRGEFEYLG